MSTVTPKILIDGEALDYIKLTFRHKPNFDCTDESGKDSQCLQHFIDKRALKNQVVHLGIT